MFYNNRSFRLANMPNVQIAFSNSANPDEFAGNVYKVMMTRNDNSVANAIDAMANSNSLYQGVNIKQVPELQALYKRVLTHNGPISQQDLANSLSSLFPSAVPSAEQQQSAQNTQQQPQQQPQQQQQAYSDPMLANYKRTMDLQMQSYNSTREESFRQKFKATFGMYSQYIRERQINDKDYETYKKMYEMLPQQGQPLQQNVENTRDTLGV